ncbi:MAG: nucleotidyltransferase domain-containing protein [Gammaproteobacteria bacterium]|nr:nucleotidyltransferase domain-containing protein [Gammaproteobacteria bacterium]MDH5650728.1 nucleotidyltransferase domain-containing protein [Gammaproteobacteria bacterium]
MEALPANYQAALDKLAQRLPALLGENLFACILYGSAVRGDVTPGVSDLNLLIILNESTPEAHSAIADCLDGKVKVELFVIGRRGMERSFQSFALKFRSIKRNYRLICGTDPLGEFAVSDERVRFTLEQSLRNLRLRSVHNYIYLRKHPERYRQFLLNVYTAVFTDISEILRLEGVEVATAYTGRIQTIEKFFDIKAPILAKLLAIKNHPEQFNAEQITALHEGLFGLLHHIITWMEERWPIQR